MEYVAGGNMADHILKTILLKFGQFERRDGLVMDEDEALYFFTQVGAWAGGCARVCVLCCVFCVRVFCGCVCVGVCVCVFCVVCVCVCVVCVHVCVCACACA